MWGQPPQPHSCANPWPLRFWVQLQNFIFPVSKISFGFVGFSPEFPLAKHPRGESCLPAECGTLLPSTSPEDGGRMRTELQGASLVTFLPQTHVQGQLSGPLLSGLPLSTPICPITGLLTPLRGPYSPGYRWSRAYIPAVVRTTPVGCRPLP